MRSVGALLPEPAHVRKVAIRHGFLELGQSYDVCSTTFVKPMPMALWQCAYEGPHEDGPGGLNRWHMNGAAGRTLT